MSSDIECITLDDSDDDISSQEVQPQEPLQPALHVPVARAGPRHEQMTRCNLCEEPGLLPVETDRAAHRRQVHADKLFYCDVCQPGEKGQRGFESFEDVVKHVSRENGILKNDIKNLHELIRIPEQADSLKVFRCMFCPGEGMLFVGLSEETFLEHALRTHGEKVMRCRPDKLRRECRICGEVCFTDTELGDHIKREHIHQRKYPFAGFGPKNVSDSESDSEEEEGQISHSRNSELRRSARREEKTEKSIRRTLRRSMTSRKRSGRSVEDIDGVERSQETVRRKRRREEEVRWSVSCRYCSASWPGEPDKAVLRQHREHHPEKITSTNDCFQRSCQTCGFLCTYGDFRTWQTHLSEKHPGATEVNSKSDSEVQCSYCYEIFSQSKLKSHISEAHLKEVIQCGNCPEVFPVKSDAVTHMMREHRVSEDQAERLIVVPVTEKLSAVSCLICHWDVLGGGQLEMEFHMNIKHGTSDTSRVQYFCRLCGKNKAFRDENILRNHLKEHDRDGGFKRFSREDWNKNSIRNINKHLTGGMKERQDRRAEEDENNGRRPGAGYDSRDQSHQRRFRETERGSSSRGFHPRHMQLPRPNARDPRRFGDFPGFPESRSGWRGQDRDERDGRFGPRGRGVGRGRGGRVGGRGGYHVERGQAWNNKYQEERTVEQQASRPSAIEETRNEIETMMRQLDEERTVEQQASRPSAIEETRNEIETMMRQLDEERAKGVIKLVLEDILGKVFQSEELSPVIHESRVISPPGSPVYCPPSIDSEEEEDMSLSPVSDEDCLSYECTECYLRMSVKFEVFQHLEEVHGVQGEEEFLNRRVKEI